MAITLLWRSDDRLNVYKFRKTSNTYSSSTISRLCIFVSHGCSKSSLAVGLLSGCFSRHFLMKSLTSFPPLWNFVKRFKLSSSLQTCGASCSLVLPGKGGIPERSICVMTPIAQMSTFLAYGSFLNSSGAMYTGVPNITLNFYSGSIAWAKPKSVTLQTMVVVCSSTAS